jgi:Glycine/D-amino acid oxidases (deaminating)
MRIVVVGAGLVGATSAYYLARHGHEVTLVERDYAPGLGASRANGGMLTPSMSDPWNAPGVWRELLRSVGRSDSPMLLRLRAVPGIAGWGLRFLAHSSERRYLDNTRRNLRLAAYSVAGMAALRKDESLEYDVGTLGTLKLYRDAQAFEAGLRKTHALGDGLVEVRALDAAGVVALEPGLADIRDRIAGGLHFPRDESGDARRFTEQLCGAAVRRGAELLLGVEVLGLERVGDRVCGVRLRTGTLPADVVVVTAGVDAGRLLRGTARGLPIAPVKGYSLTCTPPDGRVAMPTLRLPVVDDALHAAVTPIGTSVRIAGTAEFAGHDARIAPERLANLKRLLGAILPNHVDGLLAGRVEPWAGLRPVCADGVPCIGAAGPRGLYVNAGHGHLGWTMAAGSARLLADLVDGREPDLDPRDYSPRRFA